MNQAIQFTTKINHGTITIPPEYYGDIQEELEVEVIIKPKPDVLDALVDLFSGSAHSLLPQPE